MEILLKKTLESNNIINLVIKILNKNINKYTNEERIERNEKIIYDLKKINILPKIEDNILEFNNSNETIFFNKKLIKRNNFEISFRNSDLNEEVELKYYNKNEFLINIYYNGKMYNYNYKFIDWYDNEAKVEVRVSEIYNNENVEKYKIKKDIFDFILNNINLDAITVNELIQLNYDCTVKNIEELSSPLKKLFNELKDSKFYEKIKNVKYSY